MKKIKFIRTKSAIKPYTEMKTKKISQEKANRYLVLFFVFFFVIAVIAVFRTNVITSNTSGLFQKVEQLEKNQPKQEKTIDYPTLSHFAESFAEAYINFDNNWGNEGKNNRAKELASYTSLDVNKLETTGEKNFFRKLNEAKTVKIKRQSDCLLVSVYIDYDIEQNGKTKNYRQEMLLPIIEKSSVYSIVGRPSLLAVDVQKGKTKELVKTENTVNVDEKQREKMLKFLKLFFAKYAEGNSQELSVLMKSPEYTSGQEELKEVVEGELVIFRLDKGGQEISVQVPVVFIDKFSGLEREEEFTLELVKTKTSYIVEKLTHYYTKEE
ncbi:conjugal transfer protein [Enterococcus sp. C76]|uniref:conjugal transfer protein n=1 Tax=Enterococcus sp. C76 TaxID=3231334 RepID=UPI0034A08D20